MSPNMPAYSMLGRFELFNGCSGQTYDLQSKMQWINKRGVDDGLLNLLVQPVVNFSPNHRLRPRCTAFRYMAARATQTPVAELGSALWSGLVRAVVSLSLAVPSYVPGYY